MSADNSRKEVLDFQIPEKNAADETTEGLLPQPANAPSLLAKPRTKYSAAAIIPVWIVLSSAVIIYNNYIYNKLDFQFPVFLVTWHLTFAVCSPTSLLLRVLSIISAGYRDTRPPANNASSRRS